MLEIFGLRFPRKQLRAFRLTISQCSAGLLHNGLHPEKILFKEDVLVVFKCIASVLMWFPRHNEETRVTACCICS